MTQDNQLTTGKVLRVTRKTYDVSIGAEIIPCVIRGKLAHADNEYCSVRTGDNVKVVKTSATEGIIQEILPRSSRLLRVIESREYKEHLIATNIDQILIVTSTRKPRFKSGLLDRYLVIAEKNHLKSLICINKIDLANREAFEIYVSEYSKLGYDMLFSSAFTGEGIEAFRGINLALMPVFKG